MRNRINLKNLLPYFLIILIVAVVYSGWFMSYPKVAGDMHTESQEQLKAHLALPQTWDIGIASGLGTYGVSTLWSWPLSIMSGSMGYLGLDHSQTLFLFSILFILIGFIGMSKIAGLVAGLIYITNTYILLLLDGGQIGLFGAFCLVPIVLYSVSQASQKLKPETVLYSIFWVLFISVSDIRIIYFITILISIRFIFVARKNFKNLFYNHLLLGIILGLSLVFFHFYWILPSVVNRLPELPTGYADSGQVEFLSLATWKHALAFIQPHWPENIFGQVERVNKLFIILPILAILGFIKSKKYYWLVVAIIGVFLSKGSLPPLENVYKWLFISIPGFSMFRDPVKWYFFTGISFSALIGIFINKFISNKTIKYSFSAIVIFVLTYPAYTNKLTGTFSTPRNIESYENLKSYFSNINTEGSILWLPTKPPAASTGDNSITSLDAQELSKIPAFSLGIFGSYETINYVRESTHSAELLSILGVDHIAITPIDPKRESYEQEDLNYRHYLADQIQNLNWIATRQNYSELSLLQTKTSDRLISLKPQPICLLDLSEDINWSKYSIIFLNQRPNLVNHLLPTSKCQVRNSVNKLSLAMNLVPQEYFQFPSDNLSISPDANGWWKRDLSDLIWFRSFLQEKYSVTIRDLGFTGGWSISESRSKTPLRLSKKCKHSCRLLMRHLPSTKGGEITLYENGITTKTVNTKIHPANYIDLKLTGVNNIPTRIFTYEKSEFMWHDLGILNNLDNLEIETSGDLNIINAYVLIPDDIYQNIMKGLNDRFEFVDEFRSKDIQARVEFNKISNSKYEINIMGINHPTTLLFAQTYDSLWELSEQIPFPLFGFLNGFPVSSDGRYLLTFKPQTQVVPGLMVSVIFSLCLLSLFLFTKYIRKLE